MAPCFHIPKMDIINRVLSLNPCITAHLSCRTSARASKYCTRAERSGSCV